jgi:hypothetical protein
MSDDRLARMFRRQQSLQFQLGQVWDTEEQRMEYVRTQTLALITELSEMLQEVGWKPWATSRHINTTPALGELRDAWQFLMNLMSAISGQDSDWLADFLYTGHRDKVNKNLKRHQEGYDGVATKCPGCHRALDDDGVKCYKYADGSPPAWWCEVYGERRA